MGDFHVCERCLTVFELADLARAREDWRVHLVLCRDEIGGWGDWPETSDAFMARAREIWDARQRPLSLLE